MHSTSDRSESALSVTWPSDGTERTSLTRGIVLSVGVAVVVAVAVGISVAVAVVVAVAVPLFEFQFPCRFHSPSKPAPHLPISR